MEGLVDCRGKLLANYDGWIVSYSRKCLGFVAALMDIALNLLQQQNGWIKCDTLRAQEWL